jgi:RHS repeat-associated protein
MNMTQSHVCASDTWFASSRFIGKERDTESGNDYFEARYYASSMGRFMSPDWSAKEEPVPYAKLDDPQSLNLYSYVENNPLSKVDKDGHCAEDLCIGEGLVVLAVGLEAAREAYNVTPDGQRSLNNLANAFGASFSSNISAAKNAITGVFSKEAAPPNPAGQKGAPDHEAAVKEEADKARTAAGPGETVVEGKKIQVEGSTRRPDVQTVGADGKTKSVVEVERRPNSARNKVREAEYNKLGVPNTTRPLPPKTTP